MTSTPQAELDARTAMLRARKEAEDEAEREQIMRRFPASLSVYMTGDPGPQGNVTKILPESRIPSSQVGKQRESSLERIRKELEELRNRRMILDENMAKVERDRDCNDIAAKVNYEILAEHPDAEPAMIEKLRIRKMVEDQIKALETQEKDSGSQDHLGRGVGRRKDVGKSMRTGRLPAARPGARIDTGLKKKQPPLPKPKPGAKKTSGKSAPRARSYSPDVPVCVDTEDHVTHVYGKANYHPRRTTVHDPYMHVNSPHKKPKFRKKQAVEVVKPYFVKSAKTQTSPDATAIGQSQYYFSPSTSPVRPPISVSPTPGQLIPMAIPLGAPRISDGVETVPVIIPREGPAYRTFTPEPQKTIRIYDPNARGRPNTAVISVKGEDGPDLAVQKLDNIDIDTPDVTESAGVQSLHRPVLDELPGSTIPFKHDKDDSEGTEGSLHIELRGGAGSEAAIDYHGPSFPPVAPPDKFLSAGDIADEIDKHELEQETMRWVEQEVLARILSELYPPGAQRIQDSGPVQDRDSSDSPGNEEPVLLNPESLQLFIDAGLPIDEDTVNRLVEEELTKILREMIKRPAQDQTTRPKTPVVPPRATHAPSRRVSTPLPTPEPSPASSVSEKHLHTPSLTPESSMAESLPPKEPSPISSPEPQPLTPKAVSPPKTPEEVTLVQTPEATPPRTPTPEPRIPGTPTMSQVSVSPPRTPKQEYPDPWGGTVFPLPEEIDTRPRGPSAMTFAPPPEAVELVVRTVTPPPATPPDRLLSEPDTTTTTSSDRGESSISEGQLVISHGEVRAKMKRGQLPGIIEEIFGDEDIQRSMAFQSTLRDANDIQDYDPYSDGEIRLSMRPSMISRVAGHGGKGSRKAPRKEPFPGDDPAGVYVRPRHPLPSEDEDDELSVGEVKPQVIASRRSKFQKWREERSPKYPNGHSFGFKPKKHPTKPKEVYESLTPDSPLSMDDLQRRERSPSQIGSDSGKSNATSEIDEKLDGNVIVVTPAASKEQPIRSQKPQKAETSWKPRPLSPVASQKPVDTPTSEDFQRVMASTDQSGIIKDSLEESMRKKDELGRFFDDGKDASPAQPALKVSLTLPTVEPVISMSSEPVTDVDDVSEISAGGF